MGNIVFTICSNNYLAQAKVLSDSVFDNSENYDFYIVLCDEYSPDIDYSVFHAKFVEVKDLGIANFEWMVSHYNIIELNTAVKPFAFKYLIREYNPNYIYYLDPDTCTYCNLEAIEKEMEPDASILLTPHSLAPLPFDGGKPTDNIFLNNGIYNLGFLGIKPASESLKMIEWWCGFLSEHCFDDKKNGLFVDQLPMELVPLFFKNVKVSHHKGLNVAYWNLHERSIGYDEHKYLVDKTFPLVFFHFSSYDVSHPDEICRHSSRIPLNNFPVLKSLFIDYCEKINRTNDIQYKTIKCVYVQRKSIWTKTLDRFSYALRMLADIIDRSNHS